MVKENTLRSSDGQLEVELNDKDIVLVNVPGNYPLRIKRVNNLEDRQAVKGFVYEIMTYQKGVNFVGGAPVPVGGPFYVDAEGQFISKQEIKVKRARGGFYVSK